MARLDGLQRSVLVAVVVGLLASLALAVALPRLSIAPSHSASFETVERIQYLVHYIEPETTNASLEVIVAPDCGGANTSSILLPVRPGGTGTLELGDNKLCNVLLVVEGFPLPYRELSVPDYGVLRYLFVYPHVRALVDLYLLVESVHVRINTTVPLTVAIEWPSGAGEQKQCSPPGCLLDYMAPKPSRTFSVVVVEEGVLRKTFTYERGRMVAGVIDPALNLHIVLLPVVAALVYVAVVIHKLYRKR